MAKQTKILHLTLKSKWYDMIEAGIKKEEYRDIKDFWKVRLFDQHEGNSFDFKTVHFARGGHFHPSLPQMTLEFKGIEIRTGNHEWGAEPGKEYFVIKLGELLKSEIGGSNG